MQKMLRKREHDDLNELHDGTSSKSAAAMVDILSERHMYARYRTFFTEGDTHRAWNLWTDIPWNESVAVPPSEALIAAVERRYIDLIFLPDYSSRALDALRSSKGRAWFITRWAYEESKHLLALQEWLIVRAGYTDTLCNTIWETEINDNQWVPPGTTPEAVLVDCLAWECYEIEGLAELRDLAVTEGDIILIRLVDNLLRDDSAHMSFLTDAVKTIQACRPGEIDAALIAVSATIPRPSVVARLRAAVMG